MSSIVSEINAAPAHVGGRPGQIVQLTVAMPRRKPRAAPQDTTTSTTTTKGPWPGSAITPPRPRRPRAPEAPRSLAATVRADGIPREIRLKGPRDSRPSGRNETNYRCLRYTRSRRTHDAERYPTRCGVTLVTFPDARPDLLPWPLFEHLRPLALPSHLAALNVQLHDCQQTPYPTSCNQRCVLYGRRAAVELIDVARPAPAPPQPRPIDRWHIPRQTVRSHGPTHYPSSPRIHSPHTDAALPDGPTPRPRPPLRRADALTRGPIHQARPNRRRATSPPGHRRHPRPPSVWTLVTPRGKHRAVRCLPARRPAPSPKRPRTTPSTQLPSSSRPPRVCRCPAAL